MESALDLGAFACSINGLFGGSTGIIDNSTGTATYTLTAGNNAANGAFAGVIKECLPDFR